MNRAERRRAKVRPKPRDDQREERVAVLIETPGRTIEDAYRNQLAMLNENIDDLFLVEQFLTGFMEMGTLLGENASVHAVDGDSVRDAHPWSLYADKLVRLGAIAFVLSGDGKPLPSELTSLAMTDQGTAAPSPPADAPEAHSP